MKCICINNVWSDFGNHTGFKDIKRKFEHLEVGKVYNIDYHYGDYYVLDMEYPKDDFLINNLQIGWEFVCRSKSYQPHGIVFENFFKPLRNIFNELREKWLKDTEFSPTPHKSKYLEHIISYGEDMLPYIIEDLKKEPQHWFYALEKITGRNPVKDSDSGDILKMTEQWINWYDNINV